MVELQSNVVISVSVKELLNTVDLPEQNYLNTKFASG